MAELATTHPTLVDLAKSMDPNGQPARIIEILQQKNRILDDMPFFEANDGTSHVSTIRAGLPEATFKRLYQFIQPTKGTLVQVRDSIGMLRDYAEADRDLVDMAADPVAFRLGEDSAHIQGISHTLAETIIYGNEGTAPAEFTGLAPRYNSLSAANADNIVDAGGSGSDNTSIWLCSWHQTTGHGLFPKGAKQSAGLKVEDKGVVTKSDSDGALLEMYRTYYAWNAGITIRDWRAFGRICNIDVSNMATVANTAALIDYMTMLSERVETDVGAPAFYVNRFVREKLRLGILQKLASNLTWETVAGKRVMMFDGIPVHVVDAITKTEARVT